MKTSSKKSRKIQEKKISFEEGLKIVKSIQEKIEKMNRNKPIHPSHEFSFRS